MLSRSEGSSFHDRFLPKGIFVHSPPGPAGAADTHSRDDKGFLCFRQKTPKWPILARSPELFQSNRVKCIGKKKSLRKSVRVVKMACGAFSALEVR